MSMLPRFNQWSQRVTFPSCARAHLGFGSEYWKSDSRLYEGFKPLATHLHALGRKTTKSDLVYQLISQLLTDVLVAAGGVETSIIRLRAAVADLAIVVQKHQIRATNGIPHSIGAPAAITAWYAFSDVLTWSRTVVERVERPAGDRKSFPPQGLLPAIKPKRLAQKLTTLLASLRAGPVGRSRNLSNFVLHTALVRHPHTGAQVDESGRVVLPVPDLTGNRASNWYLLTWRDDQDGIALAEELWLSIQVFIDKLIESFEGAVPKRLRRV
ncbi:MAG TPA: hypothetical protein VFX56_05750 [Nitrospira sp.]|nr:hypothetical protein [Nitrospira sp.]